MTEAQNTPPEPETPQSTNEPPKKPSVIKSLTIKALRATINLLEKIVEKLEAPESVEPQQSLLALVWEKWVGVLSFIRTLLPESVNQKLPDWGLTTALASILALTIWISFIILSPPPSEVATVSPPKEPTPLETIAPAESEVVETLPETESTLTPEERLIASIQEQIAEVTSEYTEELIKFIKAYFKSSLLVVTISDDWYNLPESKQDKLAADLLKQAKELDFSKLDIVSLQGEMIARSPVIGSNMIILKRRLQPTGESIVQ